MALAFEQMWIWILHVPVACVSLSWHLISKYWFWWKRGILVVFIPSFRNYFSKIFQAPYKKQDELLCRGLKKIYVSYETCKPVINISDPDIIKEMLRPSFDPFSRTKVRKINSVLGHNIMHSTASSLTEGNWEYIRKNIALAFTPGKFRRSAHIMEHCCQKLCQSLISDAKLKEVVEFKRVFDEFSMDMIFCVMFGIQTELPDDPNNVLVAQVKQLLKTNITRNVSLFQKATDENTQSFIGAEFMSGNDSFQFKELIYQIIRIRKETKQVKTDFLQLLMEEFSVDKNESVFEYFDRNSLEENSFGTCIRNEIVPASDMIAQCLLFFAEGYKMISSVLSMAVYNLALNPFHQDRLRKEIKESFLAEKRIDFDSVNKMIFLDQIICETLRLYPPVSKLQRFVPHDRALTILGFTIPKKSKIHIPLCSIHRSTQHYPNPEKFDPQRFESRQWSKRHPYAFLPFGAGSRNCIGMKFSLISIKLCLAHLLKHVRFLKPTETKIPVETLQDELFLEPRVVFLRVEEAPIL